MITFIKNKIRISFQYSLSNYEVHLQYFRKNKSNFKKKTAGQLKYSGSQFFLKMMQDYILRVEKARGNEITHDNLSY